MPFISSMRATEGPVGGGLHRSSECVVDIVPAINGRTRYYLDRETLPIPTGGEYKVYPVYQMGYRPISAKIWGAGGAGSNNWPYRSPGGGGGFASGTMQATGDAFTVICGQGGRSAYTPATINIGGGATSTSGLGSTDRQYSGGGGGFSGILSGTATVHSVTSITTNNYKNSSTRTRSILIAGGGGGGGNGNNSGWARNDGGAGGGNLPGNSYWANGQQTPANNPNYFASQNRNPNSYDQNGTGWDPPLSTIRSNTGTPSQMCAGPGSGGSYGGGGGGGYWAGACWGAGNAWPLMGEGTGGTGYVNTSIVSSSSLQAGNLRTPPQTGDSFYISGHGYGQLQDQGNVHAEDGLVVLYAL